MPATVRRIYSGLTRACLNGGMFIHRNATAVKLNSVRPLGLTSRSSAKSKKPPDDNGEVNDEPIKFSSSKASHRTWKVESSLGSQFQRPWWKVLPISLFAAAFLLWCVLRRETDIDAQLEKQLYDHLPDISDEDDTLNKSS
ncbi:protein CCSMST1-like [Channa argus]|uniref:protein CCSMST1-like n=1 Tax=Channa argus TaxID=215402 RepID=UPI0035203743